MISGTLYVSHAQPGHEATVAHTMAVLRKRYGEDFDLEVVDVIDEPARAEAAHVVATPALVVSNGAGEQRFIGNLDAAVVAAKL